MKKVFAFLAAIIIFHDASASGVFTVTHYNVDTRPMCLSDARYMLSAQSTWIGKPTTRTYNTIQFGDNVDPNYPSHFSHVHFPGNQNGKHEWYVVDIHGTIAITQTGYYTFACGSDDGFNVLITGENFSSEFSSDGIHGNETYLKTVNFSRTGHYFIRIIYYEGGGASALEFSATQGSYSSFSSSAFRLVEAAEGEFDVSFNANGGIGEMEAQSFEATTSQRLANNLFTRDGYVFQGWATSLERAVQRIVDYADGAEIIVDSDMTLYAVWAAPALTLEAESADWSHGSITLRCADADTSGAVHKYSLFYEDENDARVAVRGSGAANVSIGADGFAHLTDVGFLSRLDGIAPVKYFVKDENGRWSNGCLTRQRFGLFVGLGDYKKEYKERYHLTELGNAPRLYAERLMGIASGSGRFVSNPLTETRAKCQALDDELDAMVAKSKPGDICLFYVATHGGMEGTHGVLCLYDGDYTENRLTGKIEQFHAKDVAFVAVLSACQSEALVQRSFPNVGIIAAARAESFSDSMFDEFLIDYGWNAGWAGTDGTLSFGELAEYAKARYDALFNGITFVDESDGECFLMTRRAQIENHDLLYRITAGTRGTHDAKAAPSGITGVGASQGQYRKLINVWWNKADRADKYCVFYGRSGIDAYMNYCCEPGTSSSFSTSKAEYEWMTNATAAMPARFEIRAYNGDGVSASGSVTGWVDALATPAMTPTWLDNHPTIAAAANGDVVAASTMTAANGKMTVGECYACGINPEDPNDDLRITDFRMDDGKAMLTLNHEEDGSGNSFLSLIRTLGAKSLEGEVQWDDVTDIANPDAEGYRFFKATVEMP